MNSRSLPKTLNAQHPTSNAQRSTGWSGRLDPALARLPRHSFAKAGALAALICALTASPLYAQVGDNNVTGHSGIFNGQAGSCGYDPYTGNATRSITDIAVAGAVGEYPLALVRTANSRTQSTTEVFGRWGGWNHNYNWTMDDSPVTNTQNSHPVKYTVNFPDGRVETFRAVTWDGIYRVRPGADTPAQSTSAGVRERFLQLDLGSMYAYLVLPDGGVVEFTAQQKNDPNNGRYWYTYHVTAINDPHGLRTTIDSEVVGGAQRRRITKVTEPAGRWLQFYYPGPNAARIDHVTASDGRTVQYSYYYWIYLDHVVYYGHPEWTAHYTYCGPNVPGDLPWLLYTCDDPMYAGPMHKIAYVYRTANNYGNNQPDYGQISSENYYDGSTVGTAVSTLTAPSATTRIETRGDTRTRTFTYTGAGYLTSCTDFMNQSASQTYDGKNYINSVTDRNHNRTDYTNDPITGNVLQIQFPFTHEDTPNQSVRPSINYVYGGAGCSDPNNGNPYWLCAATDEAGNQTQFKREPVAYRLTRINYPDGGYETFSYDARHFYQLQSHRMVTGGTETWSYDARHRTETYRNPDNASGNPTARYLYDNYDRVSDITDVLGTSLGDQNHTTSLAYNLRGQITVATLPKDPVDNVRRTIRNGYNDIGNNAGDGTLISVTDQLNHITSYTYDDYRRVKSVTPPARDGTHITSFYYGANAWDDINDYKLTDSNVTWIVPPSSGLKKVNTVYDENRRKSSVTAAAGTLEEATTSYIHDSAGNVTWVTNPLGHNNVHTLYDARNRPYQITVGPSQTTAIWYDTAGRRKQIDRPNGQVITYDSFDAMNRVTQQSATNTRGVGSQLIRSSYSYYPYGPANLLNTFQDPHLFGGSDRYTYSYDGMGRKRSLQYALNGNGVHRSEQWSYDAVGRLYQFINRDFPAQTQTFYYDALNRMISFTWSDNPTTPNVTFSYDAASRLTGINNANAVISRTYFNDNLLKSETETATGGVARAVNYTYDADGNRASLGIPGYMFNYNYTNRNQLENIINNANNGTIASYAYNVRGNLSSRSVISNSTSSNYNYDVYDRVTSVNHNLTSGTRSIQYGYDDANHSNNRLWAKRVINAQSPENNKGEVFSYDLADQVGAFQLNVLNPNQVPQPLSQTMLYDPNGNRQFTPTAQYGAANDLSQYTTRTIAGNQTTAVYDPKGNTTIGLDGSTYTYDAQNRLLTAAKNGVSMTFKYDGLNRQVKRIVTGGANPGTFYSVWDGWDLVEDYHKSGTNAVVDASHVYGATGLVRDMENANHYFYQDASGSTSHLANNSGTLVEWYRYDLQGTPVFYGANDSQLSASNYSVRHLFTGQQWHQDIGLYDLRNRSYSPDIGRFLQPDPIGFRGGNNLYRYCRNNPVTRWDPFGLQQNTKIDPAPQYPTGEPNVFYDGMTPEEYREWVDSYDGPQGDDGPNVTVSLGPGPSDSGAGPTGMPGGLDALNRPGGFGGIGTGNGGPGGKTLANSPATTLLGNVLQSFNSQGGWNEMAHALDAFAAFEANLLMFGEGRVAWGVGRYVLGPSVRATFTRGTIQSTVLRRSMTVFRYWGGESRTYGSYLTTADTVSQISSSNAASIALALPEGNTAATLTRFTIPAGTRVWTGGIAGGADTATQVYVLNPDVLIIGGL